MTVAFGMAILLLAGFLTLASYLERIYAEMGRFLSRDFQENIEAFEQRVEPHLGVSRNRAALSMSVLAQLTTAALGMVIAVATIGNDKSDPQEIAKAAVTLVLIIALCNRLLPFVLFTRTKGLWLVPFVPLLRIFCYLLLVVTIPLGFSQSVAALAEESAPEEPEHPREAVDALIEAGREEGILEEADREMIQSVVEFGDTTVREVMTPRPEIFAVPASCTTEQLRQLLRSKPYSRIPLYEGSIDKVIGIVYAHDIFQLSEAEVARKGIREFVRPVNFVPESQLVRLLLREMQKTNVHMAVVIDEYGSVAGVVTIEDLVEEIVGEIRDEHDSRTDVVRESESSYIVPGTMDVYRLEEFFHVRPEAREATTVAGLVSERLGRIPDAGEVLEENGLRFEVLQSTDRRVERLRISTSKTKQPAKAKV